MFFIIIIFYTVIGLIEMYPMIKNKQKKELILYSVMFSAAFIVSLLLSFGVKFPSPHKFIKSMVMTVLGK